MSFFEKCVSSFLTKCSFFVKRILSYENNYLGTLYLAKNVIDVFPIILVNFSNQM